MKVDTHKQLSQIEKDVQDDFSLFEEIGPTYFTTEELFFLKGQAIVKKEMFDKALSFVLWSGLSIPVLLALSFIIGMFGYTTLATLSLKMLPISTIIFFIGLLLMQLFFKDRGHSESVEFLIKKEINFRRSKE